MKKLIIIGALLIGLALQGLAQTDVISPGMSGLQTRNALNTAFSEMLGVVDTVNETVRIGGIQITANAQELNILDNALVNVTELNRLVGLPDNIVTLLAGKENSLGNPGTSGYVLSSTTGGVRSWVAPEGGANYPEGSGIPFVVSGTSWGTTVSTVSQTELGYIDGLDGTAASRQNVRDSLLKALAGAEEVIALKDSTKAVGQAEGSYVTGMDWYYGNSADQLRGFQALGSTIKALPILGYNPTVGHSLYDATAIGVPIYIPKPITVTGAGWVQIIAGVYTAADYNGFALYKVNGTDYDLVGSSTNDGEMWKITENTIGNKAFSSPLALTVGAYYLVAFYNQSAQTTAPAIYHSPDRMNVVLNTVTGTNKLTWLRYTTTSAISQITAASVFGYVETAVIWLY